MQRFPTASAALALAALLIVAGCGKPARGGSVQATTFTMIMDNFVDNDETYTMKAGQAITFRACGRIAKRRGTLGQY